ncbi:hypothetical protein H7200_01895 [Candidatus Saccharibacteria bacterium]|nr:hypothetical protein [Candidatus Saccharibacteria bacterium]
MKQEPYVGVSGVVGPEQHRALASLAESTHLVHHRQLLIGIKAVHKTQWLDIDNKYGRQWYPVGDELAQVLDPAPDTFNVAQMYLDPETINADPDYARAFTEKVIRRAGAQLDGVQYDMLPYHETPKAFNDLVKTVKRYGQQLIIQCHGPAMSLGPDVAIDDLKRLSPEINFVLFDASHGTGTQMNSGILKKFLEKAYLDADFADYGTQFGVAGGLHGDNIRSMLSEILSEFPDISWDAEGKLHARVDEGGNGRLTKEKVQPYLSASVRLLEHHNRPVEFEAIRMLNE